MRRPHGTRWTQVSLLNETTPPRVELPSEIRAEAIGALADLLLTYLGAGGADTGEPHESEDQS